MQEGMDVVDSLYPEYGETSGGGMRAGRQSRLFEEGNAYLDREFPLLDKLVKSTIVPTREYISEHGLKPVRFKTPHLLPAASIAPHLRIHTAVQHVNLILVDRLRHE